MTLQPGTAHISFDGKYLKIKFSDYSERAEGHTGERIIDKLPITLRNLGVPEDQIPNNLVQEMNFQLEGVDRNKYWDETKRVREAITQRCIKLTFENGPEILLVGTGDREGTETISKWVIVRANLTLEQLEIIAKAATKFLYPDGDATIDAADIDISSKSADGKKGSFYQDRQEFLNTLAKHPETRSLVVHTTLPRTVPVPMANIQSNSLKVSRVPDWKEQLADAFKAIGDKLASLFGRNTGENNR